MRLHGPAVDGHRATLTLHVPRGRGPVTGAVLVLHGGRSASTEPTAPRQLAVARMVPFAQAVRRRARRDGHRVAVARLRYRVRGWNGARRDPVADAAWALSVLRERFPGAATALVGHSMGGRTAAAVADSPGVVAVVGLAPWLGVQDPVVDLAGRRVLVLHGDGDRMTDPAGSRSWCERARSRADAVTWVGVGGGTHAMLRRPGLWHGLTAAFALDVLSGTVPSPEREPGPAGGTAATTVANLLAEALRGAPVLTA